MKMDFENKWTDEEIKAYNMKYLELNEEQYEQHVKLMETTMNKFPESLMAYIREQSKVYGFSGDAVTTWIAEWIKRQ